MEIEKSTEAELFPELHAWLEKTGVRQSDLARMLSLSEPTLSRYIRGRRPMPVGCAVTLASITGIPVLKLIADPDVSRLAKFLSKRPKPTRRTKRENADVA